MNCKMGFVLRLAVFLSIGWLIQGVVTHPNQDGNKILNDKNSNQSDPSIGDFYFDGQKANDDNVKIGRAIPQSAWSEEEKEQTQTVKNKAGTQFSDEFSFKNALSYFVNMFHELKQDILGIKEMTHLKNTKDLKYSQDNSEYTTKQDKMEESNDRPNSDTSTKYNEFEKENDKHKLIYVTDYYKNNGNKFVDDDLETSSDESDDSSHKINERANMFKISKTKNDLCISECSEIKRKPDKYSSNAEETTVVPTSQTKIPEETSKEFDDIKNDKRDDDFKPSNMEQKESKISREEIENTLNSKTGKCMKKDDNSNNLNQKNEPTVKPFKYTIHAATKNPQNENFNKGQSEKLNQNKTNDKLSEMTTYSSDSSSGKFSENKVVSDFDSKSGIVGQSTTISFESSTNNIYIENKTYASEMTSEKPAYKTKQEQITSLKPEYEEQTRYDEKSLKNNDINEYSTVSLQSHETGSEISNYEMKIDTENKNNPKEYTGKRLNVNSFFTTITYDENQPNTKTDGQQTFNSIDIDSIISTSNYRNIKNTENLNKDPSENLKGKKVLNENKKSNDSQLGKKDSKSQRLSETEQTKKQHLNDGFEPKESLKNNKLSDTNQGNNNKEKNDNSASITTNDSSPQDSNHETQNNDVEESNKVQKETQKNKEAVNKRNGMWETALDQEYEYEEYNEYFDISDEFTDIEMDEDVNENEEDELKMTHKRNGENTDELNPVNPATGLMNESQISQYTGYTVKEQSLEKYDTFLEYFYKHMNNSLFQSLKKSIK